MAPSSNTSAPKSTDEIVAYLAHRIGEIYYHDRPLVYAGSPQSLELLLYTLHDIWAHAAGQSENLEDAWRAALKREDCGSGNFCSRYLLDQPEADDDDIAEYATSRWWPVTKQLNVPILHEQLEQEFAEHILVKKKQFNR